MTKRLIYCADGTCDEPGKNTNVYGFLDTDLDPSVLNAYPAMAIIHASYPGRSDHDSSYRTGNHQKASVVSAAALKVAS
jgi:hypothetical protein